MYNWWLGVLRVRLQRWIQKEGGWGGTWYVLVCSHLETQEPVFSRRKANMWRVSISIEQAQSGKPIGSSACMCAPWDRITSQAAAEAWQANTHTHRVNTIHTGKERKGTKTESRSPLRHPLNKVVSLCLLPICFFSLGQLFQVSNRLCHLPWLRGIWWKPHKNGHILVGGKHW